MPDDPTYSALLSAVAALTDLDGCADPGCTDGACWIGCLSGEPRAIAVRALHELGMAPDPHRWDRADS